MSFSSKANGESVFGSSFQNLFESLATTDLWIPIRANVLGREGGKRKRYLTFDEESRLMEALVRGAPSDAIQDASGGELVFSQLRCGVDSETIRSGFASG